MLPEVIEACEIIRRSHFLIALTGAGISVESGIPDFRGKGGLWERYDPSDYAHIDSFAKDPYRVWNMLFDLIATIDGTKPNGAHVSLVRLEESGMLRCVITQNIDNLHIKAGSKNVIEFHGNLDRFECLRCGNIYSRKEYSFDMNDVPLCFTCAFPLKPSIVFFGEMIPARALLESRMFASSADAIIIIGTSASVYPAAEIPLIAKENHAKVIEVNPSSTGITNYIADVSIRASASEALQLIEQNLLL